MSKYIEYWNLRNSYGLAFGYEGQSQQELQIWVDFDYVSDMLKITKTAGKLLVGYLEGLLMVGKKT